MADLQAILDKGGPWERAKLIGGQLLIQGDCREAMAVLPKVDALIWDPPWGIDFKEYSTHKDNSAEYPDWIAARIDQAESLIHDGWCVVFQAPKRAWEWSSMIRREYRVMSCAKNFTQILPGAGPIWSTDFALFWKIGKPSVEHGRGRDWHVANTANMSARPKGHPCPRPLDQMLYIVECFSEATMSVLDPTMGSGTTLVACQRLGRQGIGIELDPDYWEIACRRVQQVVDNPPLFTPALPKPQQEAMDL